MKIENVGVKEGQTYPQVLEYQRDLFKQMVDQKKTGQPVKEEYLLIADHEPVITMGRHAKESNLLFSEKALKDRGVEVFRIERGGDVTYHGPGQLVIYPLIDLERYGLGVKSYVNLIEEAIIKTIGDYGIRGERVEGATGIWIGKGTPEERKICAIGIRCSRFVTMHGLALNVNTNLSAFTLINPCGFTDKGVTSIAQEKGQDINIEEVSSRFIKHFLDRLSETKISFHKN